MEPTIPPDLEKDAIQRSMKAAEDLHPKHEAPWPFFFGLFTALGFMGFSAYLFLSQVYGWLKTGTFDAYPLRQGLEPLFPPLGIHHWWSNPQDWIGLHKILQWILEIPTALAALASAIVAFFVGVSASRESRHP